VGERVGTGASSSHRRAEMDTRREAIEKRKRQRVDRNGNIGKDVQRDIATHPTQRSQTTSAGNYLIPIAEQTGESHPSPIVLFMLSSLFDGLEVLDPLQSCDKQAGESSSRCFYKAKAYGVLFHDLSRSQQEHIPVMFSVERETRGLELRLM
jgi:hypothetical protein